MLVSFRRKIDKGMFWTRGGESDFFYYVAQFTGLTLLLPIYHLWLQTPDLHVFATNMTSQPNNPHTKTWLNSSRRNASTRYHSQPVRQKIVHKTNSLPLPPFHGKPAQPAGWDLPNPRHNIPSQQSQLVIRHSLLSSCKRSCCRATVHSGI